MSAPISRREALQLGIGSVAASAAPIASGAQPLVEAVPPRAFLTPHKDFVDVSRGTPIPHTLKGEALIKARLTPETWRLEIVAEENAKVATSRRIEDGTALDYKALLALGEKHGVRFLKAMQCNNIPLPLGQGLWEGVPLRVVLQTCGALTKVRRLYYWGFHNNVPEQMFQSSISINQVLDTPPGDLPPFVAYKLNGAPLPLERGGPVRMIIPWAHGFKSVKWLEKIVLTSHYAANDTYALQENDPESYLKTAAYFQNGEEARFGAGTRGTIQGTAIVGWPGLARIEYWLRPALGPTTDLSDCDPAWRQAQWHVGTIDPPPNNWTGELPQGVSPATVWGFSKAGLPKEWPMRFSIAQWTITLPTLKAGQYELRVRTVDRNGFAQPEPRTDQHSGLNRIQCKRIRINP